MNAHRRVSVCIPAYNHGRYIRQCLESILVQSGTAMLQILVGDDDSGDDTGEIVACIAAEHPGVVTHLRRQPRMGAFENLRDLIARADAEFIARTDGDDYWLPGKLQWQLDYLQAHPDCAAVYTNAITVDEAGERIGLFNDVGDACFDLPAMLRRGNFLNNSSALFRNAGRGAWLDVDVPQIDYRAHLWHARHGWLAQIAEPLTVYRVNAQGSMVADMNDRVRELYWEAIRSVPLELVSDDDYARGLADFLRRVFFRAARTRRRGLFRDWRMRVHADAPCGALRLDAFTAASIVRIAAKEAMGRLKRDAAGKPVRVLYRR